MQAHLTLDDSLSAFIDAARARRLVLARYDNPETPDDEGWRLLQPMRIVQAKVNLLGLFWQYGPIADYRTLRFHFFTTIKPTPYPALFDTSSTFNLDLTIPWAEVKQHTRRERPFDLRSRVRQEAEIYYLDVMRTVKANSHLQKVTLEQPPSWLLAYRCG